MLVEKGPRRNDGYEGQGGATESDEQCQPDVLEEVADNES